MQLTKWGLEARIQDCSGFLHERTVHECRKQLPGARVNIADYRWPTAVLALRSADRPIILIRLGDHQPQFTKEVEISRRFHRTEFSIEGLGTSLAPVPEWGGYDVDIAYLPALVPQRWSGKGWGSRGATEFDATLRRALCRLR